MAFSKEDRREVYLFFENLLLDAVDPIFYEHLRGHVVKASAAVKRYVTKECKGENLLKYFQTRKNYFDVSLRGEVSLKKSRYRLLSYKSEFDDTEEANNNEKLNYDENSVSEENFEDSEYSFECSNSRCYSTASDRTADWGSVEDYTASRYKLADKEKEKSDYEELTNKYFCRYLSRNEQVEISYIDVENLPKKVKRYIKNYMNNKLLSFFKSNSECYLVDEDKYVSLISPIIKDKSPKNVYVEDSPVIVDMIEESFDVSNAETQTVENFLSCVEFFVGILKKKSWVPLKNISGSLSQAPSSVMKYLKSNYENYKNFLIFVSCLFTINEREEVSLTKDCYALLKRAKKLLRLKSNSEFWSQPIENIICSLFTTEVPSKIRNTSLENEGHSSVNEQKLEHPVMYISNEDDVYSASDIESCSKISSVFEKCNASEKEIFEVESSNDCENVIQGVYHEIILDKAANETPYELENTTASLASDQENCGVKTYTKLSNDPKASSSIEEKIEIKSDAELAIKSALESIFDLDDEDIEARVSPVYDTFLENEEIFNDDNSCILSNDKIIKKQTSRDFIECAFTTQLLCLEIIEREKILTLNFEYESVKYFVEILEKSVSLYSQGKTADLNVLKGKIGQASVGVKLFLKQFYKGEKIVVFFRKYNEFMLDSHTSWIRLSPDYKKSLEKRRIENENFNKGIKTFHVHSLYNSYFHDIVAEVFDCLSKICSFLLNKPKMKFNRLCGHFSQFPITQQNFVNSLSGSGITEKLEKFLLYFNKLFFFDDIYIQINPEMDTLFLVNSMTEFNKQLKLSAEFKLPYFHNLSDFILFETLPLDFGEMRKITVECVQDFFSYTSCFNYSDLPNIVEHEVLHSLILEGKDSQCLIKLIEDCDLFELKNGQISLKDTSEQVSDNLTSHNELSNSIPDIADTYCDDNTFHKESRELEHSEICLGRNENASSLHQNTESKNQSSCTGNLEVENSPEDNKNSKYFSESSLSYCDDKNVEKSLDPDVDCIDEENEDDKEVITRLSPAVLKDSYHLDSDNDNLSCITKTTYLNEEKSIEEEALSNGTISGLQALDRDEVENENNSECNSDKNVNEGKTGIEAAENNTICRVQDLTEVSSEKPNKSSEGPDILRVDHALKVNSCENMKSNKKLGGNLEIFSIKSSHTGEAKEGSEVVKSDTRLEKTISKVMSKPNLPSEECETKLVDSESKKLCDGDLTFNSVKKSNELFDSSKSYESFAKTTASSNNKLHIDTIKISSTTCDDKSVKAAKNTSFMPNEEFENDKDNFDDKIVAKSYASDSDVSKNDENVTKIKEKDEKCTANDNNFKLRKITENLSESSPSETRPACLISKNSLIVNLLQESVKNKEEKENSELPEAAIENTSGDDKENIEKNKLNISTCLNTENTVKASKFGSSKTKSTKYNASKDVHATVKDEVEFKETTNEDSPFLDDLKRKSKNACINQILKSNNTDTEVDVGDHVKGCSKETLSEANNEAGISKDNLHQFEDDITRNKSPFPLTVPEDSKFDHRVSVLTSNETTDNKFPLKKEQKNDFKTEFDWEKNMPEESVIERYIDTEVDIGDHAKGCSKETLSQANNEAGISKDNLHQFKDDSTRNKSPFPLTVPEDSKFDYGVSVLTSNETTDSKFPLKKEQKTDFKAEFDWEKNMPEESVIEWKFDLTADLKSSDVLISDSHCHSAQTEVQGTHSNSLSSSYKLPESSGLKQYFDENGSSDLSNQNLNLQPHQCQVILLTVDSCIVETVINGCKRYIFCLKSSFFCDEHIDCLCFNNLSVGDSVQCYIPPGTGFNKGNMCISFMICRNSNVSKKVKSESSPQMLSEELHLDNSKSLFKEVSSTIPNYLSLKKEIHINHKMGECQTDISGEIKHCSSVAEKECLAKCSTVSQSVQTVEYRERKQNSCDKSLQTQVSTALQSTQTIYKSMESECQTIFSGEVKPCSSTSEKACQVQCTNNSSSTQTSSEYDEKESQTDVNTPALASSECNTDLSGPVRKYVCLSNKSSQVSSLSNLVCQATQTVPENATALKPRFVHLACDQQLHASVQHASVHNKPALTAERAYQMCDVSCQTVSTGPIMIKKYYMF